LHVELQRELKSYRSSYMRFSTLKWMDANILKGRQCFEFIRKESDWSMLFLSKCRAYSLFHSVCYMLFPCFSMVVAMKMLYEMKGFAA
jgi:hypothetical protein